MAKKGTYAAYQQLRPIEEDFGDDLMRVEALKHRFNQAREEQRRYEQNRKDKFDAEFKNSLADYDYTRSGDLDFDSKARMALNKAVDRHYEIHKELQKEGISEEDKIKLWSEQSKLKRTASHINQLGSGIAEQIKGYQAAVEKGAIHRDGAFEKRIASVSENAFDLGFDKGNLVVRYRDTDDDKILDFDTLDDYQQGKGGYRAVPIFDEQSAFENSLKIVGTSDVTKEIGNFTREQIKSPKNLDALRQSIKDTFVDKEGRPTDAAVSMWIKRGGTVDNFDYDYLQTLEDDLFEKVRGAVDTKYSKTKNYAAGRAAREEAEGNQLLQLKTDRDGVRIEEKAQIPMGRTIKDKLTGLKSIDRTFYSINRPFKYKNYKITSVANDGEFGVSFRAEEEYIDEAESKKQRKDVKRTREAILEDEKILNDLVRYLKYDNLGQLQADVDLMLAEDDYQRQGGDASRF